MTREISHDRGMHAGQSRREFDSRLPPARIPGSVSGLAFRAIVFALIWLLLSDADPASWAIGLPAVVAVVWISLYLLPPTTLSLRGILVFLPFFLWHSLRGAIDVAWRAFHPGLPIDPELIRYRLRLKTVLQKTCLIHVISLLPGTLSATLDDDILTVHVLNRHSAIENELRTLEAIVAGIFRATRGEERGQ